MIKRLGAVLGPLLVVGCAMPLPVQIASWTLDGISFLMTQKSLADHGLSMVAQKDCAIWRGVAGQALCRDDVVSPRAIAAFEDNPADTASLMEATLNAGIPREGPAATVKRIVARAGTPTPVEVSGAVVADVAVVAAGSVTDGAIETVADGAIEVAGPRIAVGAKADAIITAEEQLAALHGESGIIAEDEAAAVANFDTAAGAVDETEADDRGFWFDPGTIRTAVAETSPLESDLAGEREFAEFDTPEPVAVGDVTVSADTVRRRPEQGVFYFVVGSFGYLANARRVVKEYPMLNSAVVMARHDGRRVYRVIVGPFSEADKQAGHRRIRAAGIDDSWAISLDSAHWTMAGLRDGPASEVASSTFAVRPVE